LEWSLYLKHIRDTVEDGEVIMYMEEDKLKLEFVEDLL
jgi:hypothetical protein